MECAQTVKLFGRYGLYYGSDTRSYQTFGEVFHLGLDPNVIIDGQNFREDSGVAMLPELLQYRDPATVDAEEIEFLLYRRRTFRLTMLS